MTSTAVPAQRVQTLVASVVTPAQLAVSQSSPVRLLKSDDLPTFGLPARQTTGGAPAARARDSHAGQAPIVSRGP